MTRDGLGVVDERTMRGVLASFSGSELAEIIRTAIGTFETHMSAYESELAKLERKTLRESADEREGASARRRRREEEGDVRRVRDLRRKLKRASRTRVVLQGYVSHLDQAKTYLLTMGEYRDLIDGIEDAPDFIDDEED